MVPDIDEGACGSAIAETRRAVVADTDTSCAGADSDTSVAAVGASSLVAVADSLSAAPDVDTLATFTL